MNRFRLISIFILFVTLFALVACGGQTAKAAAQIDCTAQGETVEISDARL